VSPKGDAEHNPWAKFATLVYTNNMDLEIHSRRSSKTTAATSLHFDAPDVLDTEGVGIGLLSAVVCDPLGFVLHTRSAYQSQNVDMAGRGHQP
jgi:hypothetical protein